MKVRITFLKAPWPPGAVVGDVLEVEAVPPWALGKCVDAAEDAEVTIPPEGRAAPSGPTADELADADRDTAAHLLNQPLAAQTADAAAVARINRRLEDWVHAETEIKL